LICRLYDSDCASTIDQQYSSTESDVFSFDTFSNDRNVLVKTFTMFITELIQILWKKIQMIVKKVYFERLVNFHCMKSRNHFSNNFVVIVNFFIAQKIFDDGYQIMLVFPLYSTIYGSLHFLSILIYLVH